MWRVTVCVLRNFRATLKYPALVSYNKLPWEVIDHGSTTLHMHLAPHYEQILTVASTTRVPHLVCTAHAHVPAAQRLRVLPGRVYLMRGDTLPDDFTAHTVSDATALQYYGRLAHVLAELHAVRLLTSDDLRLLCLAVTFVRARVPVVPTSSLAQVTSAAHVVAVNNGNSNVVDTDGGSAAAAAAAAAATDTRLPTSTTMFTLYHYMRPNRPAAELTRPLEKYYVHRPDLSMLQHYSSDSRDGSAATTTTTTSTWQWTPRLTALSPSRSRRVATPLPAYTPPQSYLMGLAERLAVVPGSCFGRRSLMWGHWF